MGCGIEWGRLRRGRSPGCSCYRHGGSLTVTDCNVLVGKMPEYFPQVFGAGGNLPLDLAILILRGYANVTAAIWGVDRHD